MPPPTMPSVEETCSASEYSCPSSDMIDSLSRMLPMNSIACSPLTRCLPGIRVRVE